MGNFINTGLTKINKYDDIFMKNSKKNEENIDTMITCKTFEYNIKEHKYDKTYIVYKTNCNTTKIYLFGIKITDNNLYIHITDIIHNHVKPKLQVIKINVNGEKTIGYYLNIIQISENFKLISVPYGDDICIYNVDAFINGDLSKSTIINTSSDNTNKGIIYKCILTDDVFIIIRTIVASKFIIIYDYKNNTIHNIEHNNIIPCVFTSKCKYMYYYDTEGNINIRHYNTQDIKTYRINSKMKNIILSNDNRLLFFVNQKSEFYIYDIVKKHTFVIPIEFIFRETNKYKFYLYKYNIFRNCDNQHIYPSELLNNEIQSDIYVLTVWDIMNTKLYYWIIYCTHNNKNNIVSEQYTIKIYDNINYDNVSYLSGNGTVFMYNIKNDNNNKLVICDTKKILLLKITEKIIDLLKHDIINYCCEHEKHMFFFPSEIEIVAANNTKQKYKLLNCQRIMLSYDKNKSEFPETDSFTTRYITNIDICNTKMKSFDMFQNLLSGKISCSDIMTYILAIVDNIGRYNTMSDIIDHMTEYLRVMVLREDTNGELDQSVFGMIKTYFVGYYLMLLVLHFNAIYGTDKINVYKIKSKKHNTGLIDAFIENFQSFEQIILNYFSIDVDEP